jgi:deltex-like protein
MDEDAVGPRERKCVFVKCNEFLLQDPSHYDPAHIRANERRETTTTWFEPGDTPAPTSYLEHATPASDADECIICMSPFNGSTDCVEINKCAVKHHFHRACIEKHLQTKANCPICSVLLGPIRGTQPAGTMTVENVPNVQLPGQRATGSFVITYIFPNGIQGEEHPNPKQGYHGTSRRAFLPNCDDRRRVLRKFMRAWDARMLFTVGRSLTTGIDNSVIWNVVHHKTSIGGGPTNFGYPDAEYLGRVEKELEAIGIF